MGVIQAIVYGIVQGLTEWLPVSSTAHLRIVPALLGWQDPGAAFTAVIQLGTTLAVLIYFWKDLSQAVTAWFKSLSGGEKSSVDYRIGWGVFYGTLPVIVLGIALKHKIEHEFRSLYVIAFAMIFMALILTAAEKMSQHRRKLEEVTVKDGIVVGFWQCIALIPGASRSGSTITGALFQGFDRAAAARFSFLLSVPSVLGAGVKELIDNRHELLGAGLVPTLIATVVSFIVGYWSIGFLIGYLQKKSTSVFIIYRIILGLLLLGLLSSGRLKAVDETQDQAVITHHVSAHA